MNELHRIQALLSQPSVKIDQLADDLDISKRTLYRIKAGEFNINLSTLAKLQTWAKGRKVRMISTYPNTWAKGRKVKQ